MKKYIIVSFVLFIICIQISFATLTHAQEEMKLVTYTSKNMYLSGKQNKIEISSLLLPYMQKIDLVLSELGIQMGVTMSKRSFAEHDRLERQGDKPSKTSNHLVGLGIDFQLKIDGKICGDKGNGCLKSMSIPKAKAFIERIEAMGLTWGGRWKTLDSIHFELPLNKTDKEKWYINCQKMNPEAAQRCIKPSGSNIQTTPQAQTSIRKETIRTNSSGSRTYDPHIKLQAPLPIGEEGTQIELSDSSYFYVYVIKVYRWIAGIAGAIAILMVIAGGFQIALARGDSGMVDSGKERITGALIGLALLFGSSIILRTINPNFYTYDANIALNNDVISDELANYLGLSTSQAQNKEYVQEVTKADTNLADNAEKAFRFFESKYNAIVAAAIVGNLQVESNIDPKNGKGDGGKANGIAQWREDAAAGGRWNKLISWAKSQGKDHFALDTQLEFITIEPGYTQVLPAMVQMKNVADAAAYFDQKYEQSSGQHRAKRIQYAKGAYEKFGPK